MIAVGSRMPGWVREAYDDYVSRLLPRKLTLTEIAPGRRTSARSTRVVREEEGARVIASLRAGEYVVALDERGTEMTTRETATWLAARLGAGPDLAFLIGGADGFAPEVLARSNFNWALSRLTLPHALVRVVLAEQLYRAHSLLTNHPYHRD